MSTTPDLTTDFNVTDEPPEQVADLARAWLPRGIHPQPIRKGGATYWHLPSE